MTLGGGLEGLELSQGWAGWFYLGLQDIAIMGDRSSYLEDATIRCWLPRAGVG